MNLPARTVAQHTPSWAFETVSYAVLHTLVVSRCVRDGPNWFRGRDYSMLSPRMHACMSSVPIRPATAGRRVCIRTPARHTISTGHLIR